MRFPALFALWVVVGGLIWHPQTQIEGADGSSRRSSASPRARVERLLAEPFRGDLDQHCVFFLDDHENTVRAIGKEGVPFLIQALRNRDPDVRLKAVLCLNALGPDAAPAANALRPLLESRTDRQAYWTIICLGEIGKASVAAVPDLLSLLKHPRGCPFWDRIGETIGRIAADSGRVPGGLSDLLNHQSPGARQGALFALGECGGLAKPLVPKIVVTLRDPYLLVRIHAALALGKIRQSPQVAIPALVRALRDEKPSVQSAAASALGEFGPEASKAVPALIMLHQSNISRVRAEAATALGKIGPAATQAVPALIKSLADQRSAVRLAAAEALGRIGPTTRAAIRALMNALDDTDEKVRQAAEKALNSLRPPERGPK